MYIYIYGYSLIKSSLQCLRTCHRIHRSCPRLQDVVHVSQKFCTFHRNCACFTRPPNNVRVHLLWNGRLSLGALNRTIPIYIYMYIYILYTYGHSPHDLPPTSSMFPSIQSLRMVITEEPKKVTIKTVGKKWKYITIFWDSLQRSPRRKPKQPCKNKKQDSRKRKNYIQYFETPGWTPPSPRPLVTGFLWFFWFFFGFLSFVFCIHEAIPKTSRWFIFFSPWRPFS